MLSETELKNLDEIKNRYPDNQSVLLPALWMIQDKYGFVSQDSMKYLGDILKIPYNYILGVVTFYTMFNQKPMGKYQLQVCTNISCMLRGGYELFDYISQKLKIKNKGITEDGMFSIEEVECLGSCATAPVMQVNNKEYYENLDTGKLDNLIEHFKTHVKEN
jgi:NADH-quinone oxidoreductase E subunit